MKMKRTRMAIMIKFLNPGSTLTALRNQIRLCSMCTPGGKNIDEVVTMM